jgi:hypothetical protein
VLVEARRRLALGTLVKMDLLRVLIGGQAAEAGYEVLLHVEIVGHRRR